MAAKGTTCGCGMTTGARPVRRSTMARGGRRQRRHRVDRSHERGDGPVELRLRDEVWVVEVVDGVDDGDAGALERADPRREVVGRALLKPEVQVHEPDTGRRQRGGLPHRRLGSRRRAPEVLDVGVSSRVVDDRCHRGPPLRVARRAWNQDS